LFIAGRLRPGDERSISVIGSRRASPEGLATAGRIAASMTEAGFTIVSGLAAGIDTAAHTSVLRAGGRTVAVIGTGLSHSYPPENAGLQRQIAEGCAVVSQFWPETPPSRQTFPMRNAVMSGLALGTVIVEASARSGARVQARRALAHGRPVFLVSRLLRQAWADELATRPGVHMVDEAAQIVETVARLHATDALVE
jgi:DNA processing protein